MIAMESPRLPRARPPKKRRRSGKGPTAFPGGGARRHAGGALASMQGISNVLPELWMGCETAAHSALYADEAGQIFAWASGPCSRSPAGAKQEISATSICGRHNHRGTPRPSTANTLWRGGRFPWA